MLAATTPSTSVVSAALPSCSTPPSTKSFRLEAGPYAARLALTESDREAAFRLRFLVFNLELNEGLESAYADGCDRDRFDEVCDHLIVEERSTGTIVGTYRLQLGEVALRNYGYYSEQEFCFTPYEPIRSQIVELGRACIHRDHRSSEVLNLLWRGITRYSLANGGRYMVGCCSLSSLDPATGYAVYDALANYMVEPELRTVPTTAYALPRPDALAGDGRPPKLLRTYLAVGARICGPPAIDREFCTIDFLTLLDLHTMHPRVAQRLL
ncbi:MAG: GNAT family N-acetyltransferase [Acidobacteriaceae bacterium]|nr:GNAT family N-acetyltransferase [Acidobacteriaceae bacterium]